MTNDARTTLDRLMDDIPVGPAPIDHLLAQGRAAKRRKRRTSVVGAAVATALVVGGGFIASNGVLGSNGAGRNKVVVADAEGDLTVAVESGVSPSIIKLLTGPTTGGGAVWQRDDQTLIYVSGLHYSSSCPPEAAAEVDAAGAVTVVVREGEQAGICTSDAGRATVTITGLRQAPSDLVVTDSGETETIPVESLPDNRALSFPPPNERPVEVTRCSQVRVPEEGFGEGDFNVDAARGLLGIYFSDVRGGTYRNIAYTVRYRADPSCSTTPAMAELIARVVPAAMLKGPPNPRSCRFLAPLCPFNHANRSRNAKEPAASRRYAGE